MAGCSPSRAGDPADAVPVEAVCRRPPVRSAAAAFPDGKVVGSSGIKPIDVAGSGPEGGGDPLSWRWHRMLHGTKGVYGIRRNISVLVVTLLVGAAGCTGSGDHARGAGPAQASAPSIPKGFSQAFVTATNCRLFVRVSRGLIGACAVPNSDPRRPIQDRQFRLFSATGVGASLAGNVDSFDGWAADSRGDLVTVRDRGFPHLEIPGVPGPYELLVVDPSSGKVKKAVKLPGTVGPRLVGVSGTTAVLDVPIYDPRSPPRGHIGPYYEQRLVAYDVSGAKRWDVPYSPESPNFAQVVGDVVLISGDVGPTPPSSLNNASMVVLRLADGKALWRAALPMRHCPPEHECPPGAQMAVGPAPGHSVFYDTDGVAWSLTTGAQVGPGASHDPAAVTTMKTATPRYIPDLFVTYHDDLIVSDPLRRITPAGTQLWSVPGNSGLVGTDGRALVVVDHGVLAVVDPATGTTVAQVAASVAPVPSCSDALVTGCTWSTCHPTLEVLAGLAAVGGDCDANPTTVYRIGDM